MAALTNRNGKVTVSDAVRSIVTLAIVLLVIASAAVFATRVGLLTRTAVLPPSAMILQGDHAVAVDPVPGLPRFPFGVRTDGEGNGEASGLILYEDGRPLGPMHALHAAIRADGGGAYSFWNNGLLFSTSDGSDPRTNGRVYSIRYPVLLRTGPSLLVWGLTLAVLLASRRPIARRARLWVRPAVLVFCVAVMPSLLLADIALSLGAWTRRVDVPAASIEKDARGIYVLPLVPGLPGFPFAVASDDLGAGDRSSLRMFEDGAPMGPAHESHAEIAAGGRGGYSHWSGSLLFSTPDGSDPRTDGRSYSVRYPVVVRAGPSLVVWGLTLLGLFFARSAILRWTTALTGTRTAKAAGGLARSSARSGSSALAAVADPLGLTASLLLLAVSIALSLGLWTRSVEISPHSIGRDGHGVYTLSRVPGEPGFPFAVTSDELGVSSRSTLLLFENDRRLGPAHATHDDIRSYGGGRYSHWVGSLIFSTSDGTDPRTNGRIYSLRYFVTLAWPIRLLAWFSAALFLYRARGAVRRNSDMILIGLGGAAAAVVAVAWTGVLPPLNANMGAAKDWPLIGAILEHLAIGLGFFGASALLSLSLGTAILRHRPSQPAQAVLVGYPAALVVMLGTSAFSLSFPGAGWLSLAVWLGGLVPLAIWRLEVAECVDLVRVALRCLAPVAVFAIYMALLLHGPTATLEGVTEGDIAHSAGVVHMMAAHLFPTYNLGSEGDMQSLSNPQTALIGAALLRIPGFDAMLFLVCSNAVYYGLWLAISLAAVNIYSGAPMRTTSAASLIVILALAAVRYPSFIVDSPAVSLALPLVFSVSLLAEQARGRLVPSVGTAVGVVIGSACSKLVLVIPLGLLAVYDALAAAPTHLRRDRIKPMHVALVVTASLIAALYVVESLRDWGPVYWRLFEPGPETRLAITRDHITDPLIIAVTAARDIGWVLLGFGVARLGLRRLTAAYCVAVATELIYPYLFYSAAVMGILLIPIALLLFKDRAAIPSRLLWIGSLLMLPFPLSRDYLGSQTSYVYLPCYGALCWLAIMPPRNAGACVRWASFRLTIALAGVGVIGLVAAGSGVLRFDSGLKFNAQSALTPGMYDMWRAVRSDTPRDALIFTDVTGDLPFVASGWNSYAASGERQIYISSWMTSFNYLRIDEAARAKRLFLNAEVLDGAISPDDLELSRRYGSYYAVVHRFRPVPSDFSPVYENAELSLYSIPAKAAR